MTIRFYSTTGEFGAFSNFSGHPIQLDGHRWPTVEHFFQAQKFIGTPLFDEIRKAKTPGIAAKLGRSRKVRLRPDWESVKVDLMRRAVEAKFRQHADLQTLLVGTSEEIVEETDTDDFWGCGSDGKGRNMLGRLLVELRERLRQP